MMIGKWKRGDQDYAKNFHNCVNRPMINIDIDHVAPPYLHILLGIMKRHHELLESTADELDLNISAQGEEDIMGVQLSSVARSLRDYGGNWQEAESIKNETNFQESLIQFGASHVTQEDVDENVDRLDNVEKIDLPARSGPISSQLDRINKEWGKIALKFPNRSYIGNQS